MLRSPLPEINPIQFTTTLDMARCNTQQLEDLLLATNHLRRLVVRYLLVMDQSSLETAANPSLESMSLHCAPESTVRDTSIELATASFPALLECGIYDGPITAIGPASGILDLLVLENCQIDIRTDLYLPIAKVTLKGCRLFSDLTINSRELHTSDLHGHSVTHDPRGEIPPDCQALIDSVTPHRTRADHPTTNVLNIDTTPVGQRLTRH